MVAMLVAMAGVGVWGRTRQTLRVVPGLGFVVPVVISAG